MWYEWNSLEEFDAWHRAVCAALGLPKKSVNMLTQKVDNDVMLTSAYTLPHEVDGKIIAVVESHLAESLIETQLRPPTITLPS